MAETYDPPRPWTGEIGAPLRLVETGIRPEWVDAFGHVNVAHYLTICDHATWAFWNWINAPEGTMEARGGHEYVVVENHLRHLDELLLDEPIRVETQLLAADDKRLILFHGVRKTATAALAATNEAKLLAFDLSARRPEPWRTVVAERLEAVAAAHAPLGPPEGAGAAITLRRA